MHQVIFEWYELRLSAGFTTDMTREKCFIPIQEAHFNLYFLRQLKDTRFETKVAI